MHCDDIAFIAYHNLRVNTHSVGVHSDTSILVQFLINDDVFDTRGRHF